ncbi:MAG: AAA family ATPase, partial [Desulfuromonadales bacterium]|nr:AAA family ATPase [Desulfuromonadales bacterium]
GVKAQSWSSGFSEKGTLAVKTVPEIIIIDDHPASGELLQRIRTIKNNFPQIALLVVSENKDPQHIIDAMKSGAAEYLVAPVKEQTLLNAVEDVRARLVSSGQIARGSVYSFISAKGGVGATVLAVNTATALALDKNSSAALIDMSFQSGDASVLLDLTPQNTITDICSNFHRLDFSFLRGVMVRHASGLDFLAAPFDPEDSEGICVEHIEKIIGIARKLYDHTVLDCTSMHINDCSVEAFRASDKVFVVTDMSVPSIRNTVRLCKLIVKLGVPREKIEIVINRYIKGGALSLGEIEKNFDKTVYWLVPNDFADIVSSINRGVPLAKMSPGAPFSKNITQFTKKIRNTLDDPDFRGIRGTFGKSL